MISETICGGDPISPGNNRHVELAIDMGLNYLDTAPGYGDGQSEMGYAPVIQGSKRDRVLLTTKVSVFPGERIRRLPFQVMGFDLLTHRAPPRPGPRPEIGRHAAAATASAIAESSVEHRATDFSNAAWDADEQTTGVEGFPLESAILTSAPPAFSKYRC